MVVCLERGADLHTAQLMPLPLTVTCFSKIQTGFTFLVPAHLGSPGQRAVKRVCVCVCVSVYSTAADDQPIFSDWWEAPVVTSRSRRRTQLRPRGASWRLRWIIRRRVALRYGLVYVVVDQRNIDVCDGARTVNCIHRVTKFCSISMPAGFCRHFVGKTLIYVSYCDTV